MKVIVHDPSRIDTDQETTRTFENVAHFQVEHGEENTIYLDDDHDDELGDTRIVEGIGVTVVGATEEVDADE